MSEHDDRPITVSEILPFLPTKRGQVEVRAAIAEFKVAVLTAEIDRLHSRADWDLAQEAPTPAPINEDETDASSGNV